MPRVPVPTPVRPGSGSKGFRAPLPLSGGIYGPAASQPPDGAPLGRTDYPQSTASPSRLRFDVTSNLLAKGVAPAAARAAVARQGARNSDITAARSRGSSSLPDGAERPVSARLVYKFRQVLAVIAASADCQLATRAGAVRATIRARRTCRTANLYSHFALKSPAWAS